MNKKTGLIAGILAGVFVVGGGITAFAIANHNNVKVTDVSTNESVMDLDADTTGSNTEIASITDSASMTEAEEVVDEEANLSPLMKTLKGIVTEKGAAATGVFEGSTVNATTYWQYVDFGYTSTGVLEAEILEQDPSLMLVYYLGTDSYINVALYKESGGEVAEISNMPLSHKDLFDMDVNFLASNDIINAFGTEGIMSAKTISKDGETYLVALNNDWFVSSDNYYSDSQRGYTAESTNHSQLDIYKVNADGIQGLYQVKYSAYGMDGAGQIFVSDFANNILEEYHYGDLEENPHTLENFMGEYNQAMANIGFPELTNTDNFTLTQQGCLGDVVSWQLHWDCNTHLDEGDNVVTLELNENSAVEESWRDWAPEVPVAEESTSTDAAAAGTFDAPSQSFEDDEARYAAFFVNEYAEFDDSMYLSMNGIAAKYAYADLDKDGLDEMLIGDDYGVYAVISESGGAYNRSEVCGWRIQYGATPCEYLGSGCFKNSVSNGNNYGGEFMIEIVWKYNNALQNCGILARLSSSWDPNNLNENLNNWELYVANDETNLVGSDNSDTWLTPDNLDYTYSYIDYGNNYNFTDDGELESNDLIDSFNSVVSSHTADGAMNALTWYPVP